MPDQFAQAAYISVTESGANTLTFQELPIASDLSKKKAMVIHRIEYMLSDAVLQLLVAAADAVTVGLSLTDSITSVGLDKVEVFDRCSVEYSAGANFVGGMVPVDRRFNDMPGGGLLVPVKKLYGFVQGVSLASAANVKIRIWYTIKDLKPIDYIELVDAYNIIT